LYFNYEEIDLSHAYKEIKNHNNGYFSG
jgi:hypothetical protein